MTKDEINRVIAEEVMGWYLSPLGEWWVNASVDFEVAISDWNPYERIDHSWMVVEKLRDKGYWISIFNPIRLNWHIEIQNEPGTIWKSEANTAPAAICLATLETVKEDKT